MNDTTTQPVDELRPHEFEPDIAGLDPEHCRILECGQRSSSPIHTKGAATTTKATADLATPIIATLFHGETRHEIKDASGRIILIADILPEHVAQIVRAVNSFDALVGALWYARTEIDILPPKQRQQRKVALQMIDAALAQADGGENGGGR